MFGKTEIYQSEFEKNVDREIDLTVRKEQIVADLKQAEFTAGEAFGGDGTQATVKAVAGLQDMLAGVNRAIAACRATRNDAFRADNLVAALELRNEAAVLCRELDTIQTKTNLALKKLSDAEGVQYQPEILCQQRIGLGYGSPRSLRLRLEIGALEDRIAALENAVLPEAGMLHLEDATSSEQIIRAALMVKSAGPTAATVQRFLDACERGALPRGGFGDLPRFIYIAWNDGVISRDSHIFVKGLCHQKSGDIHGTPGLDLGSGRFSLNDGAIALVNGHSPVAA